MRAPSSAPSRAATPAPSLGRSPSQGWAVRAPGGRSAARPAGALLPAARIKPHLPPSFLLSLCLPSSPSSPRGAHLRRGVRGWGPVVAALTCSGPDVRGDCGHPAPGCPVERWHVCVEDGCGFTGWEALAEGLS